MGQAAARGHRETRQRTICKLTAIAAAIALSVTVAACGEPPRAKDPNAAQVVLLIPGLGGNTSALDGIDTQLKAAGLKTIIANIGDGQGDLSQYANDIAAKHNSLDAYSIIGYSAGGLIARSIAQEHPDKVVRAATIASPHQGSGLAQLGSLFGGSRCNTACRQIAPGSDYLNSLNGAPDNKTWLSLWTSGDEAVTPASNAELDGAINVRVQDCAVGELTHSSIVRDPTVIRMAVEFMQGRPPVCPQSS
jgi:triacylglycerol lipase